PGASTATAGRRRRVACARRAARPGGPPHPGRPPPGESPHDPVASRVVWCTGHTDPQTERPVDAHHPPDLDARRLLAGLAVPALALALAACGDDDESSASSESFCDAAREIEERFSNIDPSTPEEFEEAIAAINELDPPA